MAKTARIDLRVLPSQKSAWLAAAAALGLKLQSWIEARCDVETAAQHAAPAAPAEPTQRSAQVAFDPQSIRRVVCAAVKYPDGTVLVGPRHFDAVMLAQYRRAGLKSGEDESIKGFLDQEGRFMTREEAHVVATEQGQIRRHLPGDNNRLFSENLY